LSSSDILGLVAGVFTTFAVIPQIMRVYKLKSAHEISLIFTATLLTGVLIWLVYGIVLGLAPLIIWNSIGAVLNACLLLAKFRYGRLGSGYKSVLPPS
jgi:MtN3 and saliva related transmembrane protein